MTPDALMGEVVTVFGHGYILGLAFVALLLLVSKGRG